MGMRLSLSPGHALPSHSPEMPPVKGFRFLVTIDGIGLSKPSTTRAKAMRKARWWARRCPGLVEVRRDKGPIR